MKCKLLPQSQEALIKPAVSCKMSLVNIFRDFFVL